MMQKPQAVCAADLPFAALARVWEVSRKNLAAAGCGRQREVIRQS
jgi:hypothetical protein